MPKTPKCLKHLKGTYSHIIINARSDFKMSNLHS